jgi:biofilm PGA synthesis N-glycosyltransferase PgaC
MPTAGWKIRSIAAFYEKYKPEMIICPVQIKESPGLFGKFQELEFLGLQGITAGTAIAGDSTMCNGANLSFTRVAYIDNADNLHDEIASGDDIFLLHSLKKKSNSKILWLESSDATVTAEASPGLISFLRQRKRWISKGKSYSDKFTILLGIVTFVTILVHWVLLVAVFLNQAFLTVLLAVFLLKSIPDFLILNNTSVRYRKPKLMYWFIPAQIVYPIYVLAVAVYSLLSPDRRGT